MDIVVLLGGNSSERDVSLASGFRITDALRARGHAVRVIDPASESTESELRQQAKVKRAPPSRESLAKLSTTNFVRLAELKADVVFLGLHGGQGEDGTIQALLDAFGLPYTGSGHLASALAMDKELSKALFRAAGVSTADWLMAPASKATVERTLGWPVVVKPSKEGSTVGLSVVKAPTDLEAAIEEAFRYDDEVIIERFIPGRELTVAVLGEVALPIGEIFPTHEIYDYECKYTVGMAREEFPAKLAPDVAAHVQDQAVKAFRALKLSGCARIDFRLDAGNVPYCLEANTLPGMTGTSLVPQAAEAAGIAFEELCDRIAHLARER
ncbi:MAG TPA: D-alanine--D-alanine ligase [Gemmatimonadaceae bacterium]|nr:D-alanine--D-alanine ligase [Gemmatimonadaceae bacterium]